jgi:glucose-6-phosphate isomerase
MSFENYTDNLLRYPDLGFSLDLSRMDIAPSFRKEMEGKVFKALADMKSLEGGAIANPDEGRMVGHYWLRKPELAPSDELRKQITEPLAALKNFAAKVHSGEIKAPGGSHFQNLLIIGIGGSALGPQLIEEALGAGSPVVTYFFDNTDPAGMDRPLEKIGTELDRTLALVISKISPYEPSSLILRPDGSCIGESALG